MEKTKEHKMEKVHRDFTKKLITRLGRKELDTVEITTTCVKLFGNKFKGCFAQDEKFSIKNGYYVINTDTKDGRGIHWVALYVTNKTVYFYDSFCRDPKTLIPFLTKRIKNRKLWYDKKDKEQKLREIICGHLCISWLMIVDEYGIMNGKKI
jgi:hypothetical protein